MALIIRQGKPKDVNDFVKLILHSSPRFFPSLFGKQAENLLQFLFQQPRNLFSYQHTYFAEIEGQITGMTLGYHNTVKKAQNLRTGILVFRYLGLSFVGYLPILLKARKLTGMLSSNEFYSSNTAVYDQYKRQGIGTNLASALEQKALHYGAKKIVGDVAVWNKRSLMFRESKGFSVERLLLAGKIRGKEFQFYRIAKNLDGIVGKYS